MPVDCSVLHATDPDKIVLVGHSLGGAWVIKGGELSPVLSVASLAPQLFGAHPIEKLDKPLLAIHGARDAVQQRVGSRNVIERAQDLKELALVHRLGNSRRECLRKLFDELER